MRATPCTQRHISALADTFAVDHAAVDVSSYFVAVCQPPIPSAPD
jgi:hypothetical protein